MQLNETKTATLKTAMSDRSAVLCDQVPSESRALVALNLANSAPHDRTFDRPAAFVAQLLAAKAQLPQARERRRADPDEAVHAYEAALAAMPYVGGHNFSRYS